MTPETPDTHLSPSGPRLTLTPGRRRLVICLLGALAVITPLSIDMYLPSFPEMARDLGTVTAMIALSVSAYFIGLAAGQIIYGPILDRFGRKRPLYVGLAIFILTSVACAFAPSVPALLALRFIQGFGGCVASVACMAMVRDFFEARDAARIFSLLFLFVGVSPLLAPTVGGFLVLFMSWHAIFFVLGGIALAIVALMFAFLPEGHQPDSTISLQPGPVVREFLAIARHPQFFTYTLAGTFSFTGLFAFVAGSPIVFMEGFKLSAQAYSGVFAFLTAGFIISSQFNVLLLRKYRSETIFSRALAVQSSVAVIFAVGTYFGWFGFYATLALFFIILACCGLTNPNCSALSLMPFRKNAGSASALFGFLQLSIGATISTGIGIFGSRSSFPVVAILAVSSTLGLITLLFGMRRIAAFAAKHPAEFPLAGSEHVS